MFFDLNTYYVSHLITVLTFCDQQKPRSCHFSFPQLLSLLISYLLGFSVPALSIKPVQFNSIIVLIVKDFQLTPLRSNRMCGTVSCRLSTPAYSTLAACGYTPHLQALSWCLSICFHNRGLFSFRDVLWVTGARM